MSARATCPRCKRLVVFRRNGTYGLHVHRSHYCTASGLTPKEVREGQTRLGKITADYLASKAQGQTPPTEGDQMT
jgi:uncharacterized C2H2 Zn-finger protein